MVHYETGLSKSTNSEETLRVAESWFHNCLEKHDECKAVFQKSSFVPKRLVEIKGYENGELQVRLRVFRPGRSEVSYATLSHCWCSYMPFKLTRANLKSCMKSIPMQDVSKVFQDAIQLAFRWNIRFMWIDSLCKAKS